MKVPVLIKNVTIEEAQGNISSKDASKFYGSCILKYRDAETNLKGSLPVKIYTMAMVDALIVYEKNDTVLDVVSDLELNKFDKKSYVLGSILSCEEAVL